MFYTIANVDIFNSLLFFLFFLFTEPPKADEGHVVVEEGHKAILSCVTNNKSNFSIKWFHNGKHLTKSKNIRIRGKTIIVNTIRLF